MQRTTKSLLHTVVLAGVLAVLLFLVGRLFVGTLKLLPADFWIVLVAGVIGGVVESLIRNDNQFLLCEIRLESSPSRVNWGWGSLSDGLVGAGGALTVMFLFGGTLKVDLDNPTSAGRFLLTSVSFIAGVFARPLIRAAGEKLVAHATKEAGEAKGIATQTNSLLYTIQAWRERESGRLDSANDLASYALKADPLNAEAHLEKGRILKRLSLRSVPPDAKLLAEALEHATQASELRPTWDTPWFNMACYRALLGKDLDKAIADLRRAVELEPSNKSLAWEDEDLIALRAHPEFESVAGPGPPQ